MQIERLVIQRTGKLKAHFAVLNFVMENPGVQLKEIQDVFTVIIIKY